MRLFHVSEESNIIEFIPRTPTRDDLDKSIKLVWAIDERRLPNFLTPRNCPRVAYYAGENTAASDRDKFFSSSTISHAVIIENQWFEKMKNTTLYLYEFDEKDFVLQDSIAGYYVAETPQTPKAKYELTDLFSELIKINVEIRMVDNLWDIAEKIEKSTLNWSFCKMDFAKLPHQINKNL